MKRISSNFVGMMLLPNMNWRVLITIMIVLSPNKKRSKEGKEGGGNKCRVERTKWGGLVMTI